VPISPLLPYPTLFRSQLNTYVRGKRVLDVFSYIGGWGVQAAVAGAREVVCVDVSATALAGVAHNAALNGVAERVQTLHGKAIDRSEEHTSELQSREKL